MRSDPLFKVRVSGLMGLMTCIAPVNPKPTPNTNTLILFTAP
jgi:hypothetical protein